MGIINEINVKITGQVDGDQVDVKRRVIAKLEVICAEYDLELEEVN